MELHGYFRSSASYRVRIAPFNLKGLTVEHLSYHLRNGAQRSDAHLAINPQGLVPTFRNVSGDLLTQSLASSNGSTRPIPTPRCCHRIPCNACGSVALP